MTAKDTVEKWLERLGIRPQAQTPKEITVGVGVGLKVRLWTDSEDLVRAGHVPRGEHTLLAVFHTGEKRWNLVFNNRATADLVAEAFPGSCEYSQSSVEPTFILALSKDIREYEEEKIFDALEEAGFTFEEWS